MTTPAERAVNRHVARRGPETSEDFVHHDRPMRAGRRLAGCQDFLHVRGIPGGVQFFVLLVEPARVLPRVSRAPPRRLRYVSWFLRHAAVSGTRDGRRTPSPPARASLRGWRSATRNATSPGEAVRSDCVQSHGTSLLLQQALTPERCGCSAATPSSNQRT